MKKAEPITKNTNSIVPEYPTEYDNYSPMSNIDLNSIVNSHNNTEYIYEQTNNDTSITASDDLSSNTNLDFLNKEIFKGFKINPQSDIIQ